MEDETILLLDRRENNLWLDRDGLHGTCIWNVTGLMRKSNFVRILQNGKQIGLIWNVKEIKEYW